MNFHGEEITGSFAVPVSGASTSSAVSQHCRILNGWAGRGCHHLFLSLEPKAHGFLEIKMEQAPLRRTTVISLHCCEGTSAAFLAGRRARKSLAAARNPKYCGRAPCLGFCSTLCVTPPHPSLTLPAEEHPIRPRPKLCLQCCPALS